MFLVLAACTHGGSPPVHPTAPLPAEPELHVTTMDAECQGLVTALDTYRTCPNLDDNDREWVRQLIEVANQSFAAGKKGSPDQDAQHTIAIACKKAAVSVGFANERCHNGPKPRVD